MCRHQTFPELIIAYLKFQGKIEKKIQNLDISLICSDVFAWRHMCHISMFHLAIIRTSPYLRFDVRCISLWFVSDFQTTRVYY